MSPQTIKKVSTAVVGMGLPEARQLAQEHGMTIRVTKRDGRPQIGTMDARTNRLCVVVENDTIVAVNGVN